MRAARTNVKEVCALCKATLRSLLIKAGSQAPKPLLGVACHALSAMRLSLLPLAAGLLLAGCQVGEQRSNGADTDRLNRLELRVQQLEQRQASPGGVDTSDPTGKAPAGPVKSLTFRTDSADDRLRIYWADGSTSDLPCTKEQGTWACG